MKKDKCIQWEEISNYIDGVALLCDVTWVHAPDGSWVIPFIISTDQTKIKNLLTNKVYSSDNIELALEEFIGKPINEVELTPLTCTSSQMLERYGEDNLGQFVIKTLFKYNNFLGSNTPNDAETFTHTYPAVIKDIPKLTDFFKNQIHKSFIKQQKQVKKEETEFDEYDDTRF